jgi:DNA transposition AAA+ family ATPase
MEAQTKQAIQKSLGDYIARFDSQNKAAHSLQAVSSATLSQIMNNKWELIKDDMWRNIASQIGHEENKWIGVETRDFKALKHILTDAKEHSNVFAVVGTAGTGKTHALKSFTSNTPKTYLLQCNEYWNRKFFLQELLSKMGRDFSGLTVAEMMQEAVRVLKQQDKPLIVLDEADKLTDQVLYFFITLYNQLEDHCGILLCATDHLAKRIKRGIKLNKKGYNEIFSRIGRKFIELKGVGSTDVMQVCQANGVMDKNEIKRIFEECEYDLRRVKRMIHAFKMQQSN